MKKTSLIATFMLLAAMLLAACGSNANNNQQTPGALTTPGANGVLTTGTPGAGLTTGTLQAPGVETTNTVVPGATTETPAAGAGLATATTAAGAGLATATTAAGTGLATATTAAGSALATDTPSAALTGTPSAATGSTPGANVPVTGNNQCQPLLLTHFMGAQVNDSQGNLLGKVNGVIVLTGQTAATNNAAGGATAVPNNNLLTTQTPGASAAGSNLTTTETPLANGATTTQTPAANGAANTPAANGVANAQAAQGGPTIEYVVVNQAANGTAQGNNVLVPFGVFQNLKQSTVPGSANAGNCMLTVNLPASALNGAPALDLNNLPDFTNQGWDQQFRTYWTQQGMLVPQTGVANAPTGNTVMLSEPFNPINVTNTNGEELGEVRDFVINAQTGQLKDALVESATVLGIGEKAFVVPTSAMRWTNNASEKGSNGTLLVNASKDQFEAAPSLSNNSLNGIDITQPGWDTQYNNYWNNPNNGTPGGF